LPLLTQQLLTQVTQLHPPAATTTKQSQQLMPHHQMPRMLLLLLHLQQTPQTPLQHQQQQQQQQKSPQLPLKCQTTAQQLLRQTQSVAMLQQKRHWRMFLAQPATAAAAAVGTCQQQQGQSRPST
jgi:hypothetical protein